MTTTAAPPATVVARVVAGKEWSPGDAVSVGTFCSFVQAQEGYRGQLTYAAAAPPREARTVPLASASLSPPLEAALRARGVSALFCHQAAALQAQRAGQHVIVATGTSSGKSLSYMVPAIEAVIAKPTARVLLLFPTKALAQDQLGKLSALAEAACPMLLAATLDGDTPKADRLQLRQRCHVFLSNPDLLAATILPRHDEWSEVLSNLALVAVDEAHAYHGVFGSHVALVLRRLRRLCALYGASPTFVGCSATIASPRAHFALLTGLPAEAIAAVADDGAPRGERVCAVWNPPERPPSETDADPFCFREDVEEERRQPGGARRRVSTLAEAARLLALLVRHGLKTLAFVKARSVAELLVERTRALLPPEQAERLQCYRAGYSKEARRAIEAAPLSLLPSLLLPLPPLSTTPGAPRDRGRALRWQAAGRGVLEGMR